MCEIYGVYSRVYWREHRFVRVCLFLPSWAGFTAELFRVGHGYGMADRMTVWPRPLNSEWLYLCTIALAIIHEIDVLEAM